MSEKAVVPQKSQTLARVVTEILNPPWVGIAVLGIIAHQSTSGTGDFLKWWGLSALFVSIIPIAFVLRGVSNGRFTDRYVTRADQRFIPFVVSAASMLVCLVLLIALSAPRPVIGVTLAATVALFIGMLLTLKWKISVHCGTVAGGLTVLTITLGPWILPLVVLVPVVGWARVRRMHHTVPQVVLGSIFGAFITGTIFGIVWML